MATLGLNFVTASQDLFSLSLPHHKISVQVHQNVNTGLHGVVWDAAVALSTFLDKHADTFIVRKRILELGSGTGLVGLTASFLHATSVTLTDLPTALPLLQQSIMLNERNDTSPCSVLLHAYEWGTTPSFAKWNDFDLILCSDCLYDKDLIEPLLSTWKFFQTPILIAFKQRHPSDEEFVCSQLKFNGLHLTRLEQNKTLWIGIVTSRMSNIFGFGKLSKKEKKEDDDNDTSEENHRYVGGTTARGGGSGLAVLAGPGDDPFGSIVANATAGASSTEGQEGVTQVVTFYREGFTVNDGPYRPLSVSINAAFISALVAGRVPRELESAAGDGKDVDLKVIDKRTEDYVEPFAAFGGAGQAMGSSTSSTGYVFTPDGTVVEPIVDTNLPTTTLQVRTLSGARIRVTLNLTHTLQDVHAIVHQQGAASEAYVLLNGFPPKPVLEIQQTLEEGNYQGAALTMKRA